MKQTPNLELASSGGFLWPPIGDALDTFLRRRHSGADAYERVWRLIHVWEATEITLAVAAIAKLAELEPAGAACRRAREFFYGMSWNQVTRSFGESQGAAAGSIDQWINMLEEIAKADITTGLFLPALRRLVEAEAVHLRALALAWGRACDYPDELLKEQDEPFRVRQAMRYVNALRNRIAHVPIPYDPLGELADALEASTEELFSVAPTPASHEKGGESSALTGAFRVSRCFLRGSQPPRWLPETQGEYVAFVFPCVEKGPSVETWSARSFVFLDPMMRPHVLTRVKGFDVAEYTRFRAEANAVVVQPNSGIDSRLPRPGRPEYQTEEEVTTAQPQIPEEANSTMEAIEAIRLEDYDKAIPYFERLTKERPDYHVGWLRLGHAKREKAVRLAPHDKSAAIDLLLQASRSTERATEHRDPEYQALAHYEVSKVYYHLSRLEPDNSAHGEQARLHAAAAARLSPELKYQTWLQHVERWVPSVSFEPPDSTCTPIEPSACSGLE
ncbi:MAG TPA: hypothetical protein PLS53_03560 [Thermoanaerobaculaceae bacterium]|nr:hypothetical protein [Thermoanaerobaculaceae bacterium]